MPVHRDGEEEVPVHAVLGGRHVVVDAPQDHEAVGVYSCICVYTYIYIYTHIGIYIYTHVIYIYIERERDIIHMCMYLSLSLYIYIYIERERERYTHLSAGVHIVLNAEYFGWHYLSNTACLMRHRLASCSMPHRTTKLRAEIYRSVSIQCAHIYIYIYICIYMCIYIYMYTYIYIYIYRERERETYP